MTAKKSKLTYWMSGTPGEYFATVEYEAAEFVSEPSETPNDALRDALLQVADHLERRDKRSKGFKALIRKILKGKKA